MNIIPFIIKNAEIGGGEQSASSGFRIFMKFQRSESVFGG
jgi:hypothetical protein